jgi:membrane protein implicated in regulation of membrane protease activity
MMRWMSGFLLLLAAGMLVAGQTWLRERLSGVGLLAYWGACFVLTAAAMLAALLDLRSVRRRTREEQRRMFEETLGPVTPQRNSRHN